MCWADDSPCTHLPGAALALRGSDPPFSCCVLRPAVSQVDEIYHLACPASPPHYQYNPIKTIKCCTMGTINMLGLAKRVKVCVGTCPVPLLLAP